MRQIFIISLVSALAQTTVVLAQQSGSQVVQPPSAATLGPNVTPSVEAAPTPAPAAPISTASAATEEVPLPRYSRLGDAYFEGARYSRISDYAGLMQVRNGVVILKPQAELYAIARAGADVQTFLDANNSVFNDNFLFLGVGADYTGLLRGVRLTAQIGGSMDLNNRIHRGGFDFRTGVQTYHELQYPAKFFNELYSEAFYIHRYRNGFGGLQLRGGHHTVAFNVNSTAVELAPLFNANIAADTEAYDYNRFGEIGLGPRLSVRVPGVITASFRPYYVWGFRWERPTTLPNYHEFRMLLTGYVAF